jgi:hypothetical protein
MTALDLRDAARQLVDRTCAAQGLEPKVTDPDVLRRVAQVIAPRRGAARAATRTARDASSVRSDTAGEVGRV